MRVTQGEFWRARQKIEMPVRLGAMNCARSGISLRSPASRGDEERRRRTHLGHPLPDKDGDEHDEEELEAPALRRVVLVAVHEVEQLDDRDEARVDTVSREDDDGAAQAGEAVTCRSMS